ncbi:Fic family protein [Bifidobacterium amazonense]|uniref:Fic family protein n=1 Tax=Bifidobacterium amazonense TaxID=2809027 RepID=A0ABS9VU24_9BIFI|nr:Fic family protein [Bifidobacterium amazonense]MCH9275609.1 Fic family protein [Bifidobacterium amazonense]
MDDAQGNKHEPKGSPNGGRFAKQNTGDVTDDLEEVDINQSLGIPQAESNPYAELAKRREIDLLWRTANIEVAVTFPETDAIFKGIAPNGEQARKVRIVNNLKHAWQFLFDNTEWNVDWAYLSQYNRLVGDGLEPDPGMMRTMDVAIGGTDYVPDRPDYDGVRDAIARDLAYSDPEDRAIGLFCDISRGQWFANGNKRTAVLAANHQLIHDRAGVFALPPELMGRQFRDLLIDYYETNDKTTLSAWLKAHAISHLSSDNGGR